MLAGGSGMMSFFEYAAWRQRTGLPDAETMLRRAGIDPHGPHEIEVLRLVKQMKKADAQAPSITSSGIVAPRSKKLPLRSAKTAR